jgi:hypothetical protein
MLKYSKITVCRVFLLSQNIYCNLKAFGKESSVSNVFEHPCRAKGQLISKCPFGVFKSPKKTTKFFPEFLP